MFSDTHFHFKLMAQEYGVDGVQVLTKMAENNCYFGLDIGTKASDLVERIAFCEKTVNQIKDEKTAKKACSFLYFSAGIWPDIDSIHDAENQVKILRQNILACNQNANETFQTNQEHSNQNAASTACNEIPPKISLKKKVIAIGEGGLDHHWNPSGVDGRCESDFDSKTYNCERNLFEMQLELAKELKLPFIIHSRDAFEDTVSCIKNVGYHNGIVHCFSYGIDEARAFLDLGWHIAFGGGTTYTKKSKMDNMKELLNFIPEDRFLCETDAPYLSPVPLRGTPNSPANIVHVYEFIANAKNITTLELSNLVDNNIRNLFHPDC